MNTEREYEIVLQTEPEGGFSVFVPDLPSVATQGETIEVGQEAMNEDGLPIPTVHHGSVAVQRHERQAPGRSCEHPHAIHGLTTGTGIKQRLD